MWSDLQYLVRLYMRTPVSTVASIAILTVALALSATFLSLYVDLHVRPHAGFNDSDGLESIGLTDGQSFQNLSQDVISRLREDGTIFEAVVGVLQTSKYLGNDGEAVTIELVTRGFFDGLAPRLEWGNGFEIEDHDESAEPVVVLSYEFWLREFMGDPSILGTEIDIAGRFEGFRSLESAANEEELVSERFRIVGVMGPALPGILGPADFWMPYERAIPLYYSNAGSRLDMPMMCLARVRGDLGDLSVSHYLDSFSRGVDLPVGSRLDAIEGVVRDIGVHRDFVRHLQILLIGSVLLALCASCNLALFILARAPARTRELGIRMAVGATLRHIVLQLARESVAIVSIAAALALALSIWLGASLQGVWLLREAEWERVTLFDWRVLSLVGALVLVAILIVTLAPVVDLRRRGMLRSGHAVTARATAGQLVVGTAQLAIAGVLGSAAVVFSSYIVTVMFGFPGFETKDRYVATFETPIFRENRSRTAALVNALVATEQQRDSILSIPEISAVSMANAVPGLDRSFYRTIPHIANPRDQFRFEWIRGDQFYFDMLGLRPLYGDGLSSANEDNAVVNLTFARQYFGKDNVVGETLLVDARNGQAATIVGVVGDVSFGHPSAIVKPTLFSQSQGTFLPLALIESRLGLPEVRMRLQEWIDTGRLIGVLGDVASLKYLRSDMIAPERAIGQTIMAAAILVIAFAAFGVFGIQRYLVTAGRVEYAIRAALGAGPRRLRNLVLWRGLQIGIPGIALGGLLAVITAGWLKSQIVSVDVSASFIGMVVVLGTIGLVWLASLSPARSVQITQPAPLLRED